MTKISERVRGFYDELPFNYWGSLRTAARSLRDPSVLDAYPDLCHLLERHEIRSAVDCGCGAGWLTSTLALHYDLRVTGIDFSARSLERAREIADRVGVTRHVRFLEHDLLELDLDDRFDLVISLGALHHTADPQLAFARICRLARTGGYLFIGLYHAFGRRAFLDRFRQLVATDGIEQAFQEFRELAANLRSDKEHLWSWFRDQVLHPQESQHSLREVTSWLARNGCELCSTSINQFAAFDRVEDLFELEKNYAEKASRALGEKRFFPGFFTVLARRTASDLA